MAIEEKDVNAFLGLAGVLCLVGFVFIMLLGCATCEVKSHSCPEPGHGPCYLCKENKGVIYNREDKWLH